MSRREIEQAIRNDRRNEVARPTCPICGEPGMVLINGRFGEFWGCRNYRDSGCKGLIPVKPRQRRRRIQSDVRPKGKREVRETIHAASAQEYCDIRQSMESNGFLIVEFQPGIHYRIIDTNRHFCVDYKPSTGKVALKNGPSSPKGALSYLDGHTLKWVCDNLDLAASIARRQSTMGEFLEQTNEPEPQATIDSEFRAIISEDAPF